MRHLISFLIFLSYLTSQAAELRIYGVDDRESRRYLDSITPKLQYILSRPATSWRADDAAFQLERAVLRRGYPDAEVSSKIRSQTIHLYLQKGPQYYYGEILTNSNNSLTEEQLSDYFYQPIIQSESVPKSKAPYIIEFTDQGAKNVENYLKSIGYWNAQVSTVREQRLLENQRVDITLKIQQGQEHKLGMPDFSVPSQEIKQELMKLTQSYHGKVASSENIKSIIDSVDHYLHSEGYQFAKVRHHTTHSQQQTQLHFYIQQGVKFNTRSLHVTGFKDTKETKIKRFFSGIEGKTYDAPKVDKATNALLQSGVFKRATLTTKQVSKNQLDLHLDVEEAKTVTTSAYVGSDSYEGLILGLSYTDLNFMGNMWNLSYRGEWTGRGLLGEVGVTEPFFAGEKISFNVRAFALQRSPDGYRKLEAGTEASWTWSPTDKYNSRLYLGSSAVSTSSSSMTPEELGPQEYFNTRIGWVNGLDLRDDPVMPYHGYNGELITEMGAINGDAHTGYLKLDLHNSYRFTLGAHHYLISRFDVGAIKPRDSEKLPIDRRFFSGGSNSVRAVKERNLGPRSLAGDPLGGEAYWVGSAEYVRQVKGPLYTSIFYDLGQVYPKAEQLDFSDPTHGIGIGARIHLPIGPIRFEYGYNLNRKENEPSGAFHFSIGASF